MCLFLKWAQTSLQVRSSVLILLKETDPVLLRRLQTVTLN